MTEHTPSACSPLLEAIQDQLAERLRCTPKELSFSALVPPKGVLDETTKLRVVGRRARDSAVVLWSPSVSPQVVKQDIDAAARARRVLGEDLGRASLEPMDDGEVEGRSYAVLPMAQAISSNRLRRMVQRRALKREMLGWLREVARNTLKAPTGGPSDGAFGLALKHLTTVEGTSDSIRTAARRALDRLEAGSWAPRHVLMHGDFWEGNILLDPSRPGLPWARRFVTIDWASGRTEGFALMDLVRLCISMRFSKATLRDEVRRHLSITQSGTEDAKAHLLAGLGAIGMDIQHMPPERYVSMSERCFAHLSDVLA